MLKLKGIKIKLEWIIENVRSILPANDFKIVASRAAKEISAGIIIGYSEGGEICTFGGGLLNGRQPISKDWLWMVEAFKHKLMAGDYQGT